MTNAPHPPGGPPTLGIGQQPGLVVGKVENPCFTACPCLVPKWAFYTHNDWQEHAKSKVANATIKRLQDLYIILIHITSHDWLTASA